MSLSRYWLAFALFLALSPLAQAASITLTPAKDNTLIQNTSPSGQLSNGLGDIFVGRTNQDGQGVATISIRRGLAEFNVANSIPAGATITGVSLAMRDVMGLNGSPTVELHDTLQDWGQGTSFQNGGMGAAATQNDATWLYTFYNPLDPTSSTAWATPGGNFSSTVSASAVVTDANGAGQTFTWTSAQMIADVQSWLDNPSTNFGWTILGDESKGQTAKRFNSSESTTPPNVPPQLTITYHVPEPSSLALGAMGAAAAVFVGVVRRRRR